MKTVFGAVLAAAIILAVPAGASLAADTTVGGLTISNPWARASTGGSRPGVAYLTIVNTGGADSLTRASSPVAGRVELHRIIHDGGRARMGRIGKIPLPEGKSVALGPGGLHIMLMGLKRQLKEGETFPLSLYFAGAGKVDVMVRIMGAGATGDH
ncbi:MAG: copper chaperone PCu(A)C [Rhodospirillales bacterium]|nr:copper chaperone PCu(A)C [Rhodospirillales bacterium]